MPITAFPDVRKATRDGLLAVGGDLHPESLILAYSSGIFPWPIEGMPLPWFCPPRRAIIDFSSVHRSRSLRRTLRKTDLRLSVDEAFGRVMRGCAEVPRAEGNGTWITAEMLAAYGRLHEMGLAHSVEAWRESELVGGIYGVSIGNTFSAESMFRLADNASKLALVHLIDHLASRGLDWLDVQVMSPHVRALGAEEIPRDQYLRRLKETQAKNLDLFPPRTR